MQEDIINTVETLKKGKIILYPTDTVWGLGCDATNENAVKKIYEIKNRDESKSLVILVDSMEMLEQIVEINNHVKLYLTQAKKPTTVIYKNPLGLAKNVISQDNTVAIRWVQDAFCQEFIRKFGKPIVSTSANISGEKTPQFYKEISQEIINNSDYIVAWRQNDEEPKEPSTIIAFDEMDEIIVIRP